MSNTFTLDELRAEVDKEFAPFRIPLADGTEVTLRNPLRLNETTRKTVMTQLDSMKQDGDDSQSIDEITECCTKIIQLVGDKNVKQLLKEIDGDAALLMHVIEAWTGATQLGEAENSPDSSTDTASS